MTLDFNESTVNIEKKLKMISEQIYSAIFYWTRENFICEKKIEISFTV